MNITIRDAAADDFPAVLELVKELAVYQGTPEKVLNTVAQMNAEKEFFRCLVAENEQGEIVGIASYFFAYYTWVGKSLYLDDLVVKQSQRGRQAGSRLLKAVVDIAAREHCKRVRWLVSDWNKPAIAFYEKCGADIDRASFVCDLGEETIKHFISPNL